MNASNIINSLIEANKNNNKLILNLKNKKINNGENENFEKIQISKQFPQKDLSQLNDKD